MVLVRKELRILALVLAMISLAALPAFADNNATIKISCTIPEMPGINLPLVQEKQNSSPVKHQTSENIELRTSPSMLQKDTKEQRSVSGEKLVVEVKTVYRK